MSIHNFVSGYTGTLADRLRQLLLANTVGTDITWATPDLWMQFLTEHGYTDGSLSDRLRHFLIGYTGQIDTGQSLGDLWNAVNVGYGDIAGLFAGGVQGAWYDPNDLSTMFQDDAGTTPVTAAGQTVGKILDKSGKGNHLIQATLARRMTLTTAGNGFLFLNHTAHSFISAATINWGGPTVAYSMGYKCNDTASAKFVLEISPASDGANNGAFYVAFTGTETVEIQLRNTAANYLAGWTAASTGYSVYSANIDVSQQVANQAVKPYKNGTPRNVGSSNLAGTPQANLGVYNLFVGARNQTTLPANGRLYGLVMRSTPFTDNERGMLDQYFARRVGTMI